MVAAIEVAGTANANLEAKTPRETLEAEAATLEARATELTAAIEGRTAAKADSRAVRRLRASSTPKARSCARYSAAALLGPRQAAEVTVYDDAVEAVVDKSKKVAEQPSVSWCCSPPKPAMPGCSTPLIGSPQGWRETG